MVTVPTLKVAVVVGEGRLSDELVVPATLADNETLPAVDCLPNTLPTVLTLLSARPINEPVARLANDVCADWSAWLMVALESEAVVPSSTGHKLHTRRVTSQYKSISNFRNPVARRLEKHLAAAASSYRWCAKQAGVSDTPGRLT